MFEAFLAELPWYECHWLGFIDDQSTLVQVMAWCRQATSHYLSQCWPRFLSPYGVTRPQWVNSCFHFDGLMQDRCNSSALAIEIRLSCINPSIWLHTISHEMFICDQLYSACTILLWHFLKTFIGFPEKKKSSLTINSTRSNELFSVWGSSTKVA